MGARITIAMLPSAPPRITIGTSEIATKSAQ